MVYLFFVCLQAPRVSMHIYAENKNDALVCEPLPRHRKLAQLMPNHVLRHRHRHGVLPVVYKEPKSVVNFNRDKLVYARHTNGTSKRTQ